ncbi:MAG: hypothetical protein ACMG6E_05410, partial [Candidatus Roizmanbacteria bacterium]
MKKLFFLIAIFTFLILSPQMVNAQGMMGGNQNTGSTVSTSSSTEQDEAEGKAVWDKLENKQVTCSELKDDDFDVLGDFFMGNMMGSNHESMNKMMTQRLGDDGEKQMHIALGKRLSGCNANASLPNGASYFMPMMGFSGTGMMNGGSKSLSGKGAHGMMSGYSDLRGNSFEIFRVVT